MFVSLPINLRLPPISCCSQKLIKTYFLLLNVLETCQFVLMVNMRFLIFSFITGTFHDVLDKKYQHITSKFTYLRVDHTVWWSKKMWINENLSDRRLCQINSSSKWFQLQNFQVCSIQFVAHHKKVIRKRKKKSIIVGKIKLIFQGKKMPCCTLKAIWVLSLA